MPNSPRDFIIKLKLAQGFIFLEFYLQLLNLSVNLKEFGDVARL